MSFISTHFSTNYCILLIFKFWNCLALISKLHWWLSPWYQNFYCFFNNKGNQLYKPVRILCMLSFLLKKGQKSDQLPRQPWNPCVYCMQLEFFELEWWSRDNISNRSLFSWYLMVVKCCALHFIYKIMHIYLRWTTMIYHCYYCITSSIRYVYSEFGWSCIHSLWDHMRINLISCKNNPPSPSSTRYA